MFVIGSVRWNYDLVRVRFILRGFAKLLTFSVTLDGISQTCTQARDRAVIFWTCAPHRPGTHTEKCTVNNKQAIKHSFRTLTLIGEGISGRGCMDLLPDVSGPCTRSAPIVCCEFRDLGRYKTQYQVYWWWLCVSRHSILLVLPIFLWFMIWEL